MTTGRRQRGEFLECFRCSAPPPTSALRSPLEKVRADEQIVLTLKGVPDAGVLPLMTLYVLSHNWATSRSMTRSWLEIGSFVEGFAFPVRSVVALPLFKCSGAAEIFQVDGAHGRESKYCVDIGLQEGLGSLSVLARARRSTI